MDDISHHRGRGVDGVREGATSSARSSQSTESRSALLKPVSFEMQRRSTSRPTASAGPAPPDPAITSIPQTGLHHPAGREALGGAEGDVGSMRPADAHLGPGEQQHFPGLQEGGVQGVVGEDAHGHGANRQDADGRGANRQDADGRGADGRGADGRGADEHTSEEKLPHSRRFYITVAVLMIVNVSLIFAIIYLVLGIHLYHHERFEYTATAWIGFWLVSTAIGILVLLFILHRFRPHVQNDAQDSAQNLSAQRRREARLNKLRHWGRKRLPKYSILFTELAAIAAIVGYFYGGAVDTYLKFEWKLESNIGTSMPAPAFALIGNADDAAFATLNAGWRKCRFPSFSAGSCDEHFFEKPVNWDSSPYGNISYYLFDADEEVIFGKLSDQLLLQTDVNWNSKLLEAAYDTQAPYNPSLSAIMYDSRMTEDQLRQALTCNIVVWTEQPALGSNTYTIDEVTQTYDALGKLNLTILDPDCKSLAETLYTFKEGLATYRYRVSSSSTSFAYVCDQGNTTMKYDQPCVTQIIIRYGTFSTTQLTSVPGIEIKDIFLNIAAIAGGVQFVAWFMTIFQ